jgi:hypothetical protein
MNIASLGSHYIVIDIVQIIIQVTLGSASSTELPKPPEQSLSSP